jgi:hypothetical protein
MTEEGPEGDATTAPSGFPPGTRFIVRSLQASGWVVEHPENHRAFWGLLGALTERMQQGTIREVRVEVR